VVPRSLAIFGTALLLASALVVAPWRGPRLAAALAGPIAEWTFDDGAGPTATDAVGALDGTLSGGATWVSSNAAQGTGALAFDGVDDLVTVPNDAALEPSGTFSVALWFKGPLSTGLAALVAKGLGTCGYGGSWGVDGTNTGPVGYAQLTTWPGQMAINLTGPGYEWWDSQWHLLTFTVDPGAASSTVGLDGHIQTVAWPGPDSVSYANAGDGKLRFGGVGGACTGVTPFHGQLDDIRIWNRALSGGEILAMLGPVPTTTDVWLCLTCTDPSTSITSAYVDQNITYRVHVTPWPASAADITWYRSQDGAAEEVFATTPLRIVDMTGYQFYTQLAGSLVAGNYTIRATWPGADNWQASSSVAMPLQITKRPVTLQASLDPPSILPGEGTTVTARVAAINPPATDVISGSISVYETTGGTNTLVGSGALQYTGNPHWNTATIQIPAVTAGAHTYEARFAGTTTLAPATTSVGITAGKQSSAVSMAFTPNPVKNTAQSTAQVSVGGFRTLGGIAPLPAPTGTVTVRTYPGGSVVTSASVAGNGEYDLALPKYATGSYQFTATYSGDGNFNGSISAPMTLTVQTDTVEVSGVGVQYATFYPYKDSYKDTVAIRGTRLEMASVAINIYNYATGSRVRTASVGMGAGAWSWAWNGRNAAGTLQPAGKYKVVQTLTDAAGVKLTVTSYTTLSNKRLYTYTTTIKKDYSHAAKKTSTWVAWSFTLPSATVYKSLKFSIYGKDSLGSGGFGPHDFSYCSSTYWYPSCATRWTTFPTTYAWKSVYGSVVYDRYGQSVRLYAWGGYGNTKISYGRVTVTYGILK
jgi:flagellar hook assembly protein FlgD